MLRLRLFEGNFLFSLQISGDTNMLFKGIKLPNDIMKASIAIAVSEVVSTERLRRRTKVSKYF